MREGLKRRAGTEARVSILIRDFMGKPARAKGSGHRGLMVGWAVLSQGDRRFAVPGCQAVTTGMHR